jgi:hypothetical protein
VRHYGHPSAAQRDQFRILLAQLARSHEFLAMPAGRALAMLAAAAEWPYQTTTNTTQEVE